MRRTVLLTLALTLALTGCGGQESSPAAEASAVVVESTPAAPDSGEALAAVCTQHCALLVGAQDDTCPDPVTDVSACVPYLTELTNAVYDVEDALNELPYAARDYPDLLAAIGSHVEAVETFTADRCYEVTAASVDSGFACGMQPLGIIWSAATVGLKLQGAAGA